MEKELLWTMILGFLLSSPLRATAQTDDPMEFSEEAHYFDFWPGTWVEVVDGQPDYSATTFTIRTSVHAAAFTEEWRLVYDGTTHHSTALRAWDQITNRWMFVWVSDNGLFQVWEGQNVDGDWYIVREFDVDGERFLSRQAWIPESPDRVVRIMERSHDDGLTWQPRSRTLFERKPALARTQGLGQEVLPPLMKEEREVALALSAAPPHVSRDATVLVLRRGGYAKVREGTNGFTCMVDRQMVQALEPICHNPESSQTIMELFLRRTELREQGLSREEIDRTIDAAYARGELRLPKKLAFAYMLSAGQDIYTDDGRHLAQYRPHIMIWTPFLTHDEIGGRRDPESARERDPYVFRAGQRDASLNVIVPEFIDF